MRNLLNNIDINNNYTSNKHNIKINNLNNIRDTLRQNINKLDIINYKGEDNSYIKI
jgi:hypothetical protein